MAISDTQKLDGLYKKLFFGVSKTDTASAKSPSNEGIPSPLLLRGDLIWGQSGDILATPPTNTTGIISVHNDNNSSAVLATVDTTADTNRTWKTGLTNWIPPEFGSRYSIKIYAATSGTPNPQTTGTLLFPDGSGNNDSYQFDYQAGVLNFPDTNLPTALSGKVIYVVGYRYIGAYGSSSLDVNFQSVSIGKTTNLNFSTGTTATNVGGVVTISLTETLQSVTDRGSTTTSKLYFSNTTASTSTQTGSVVVGGGLGVAENITVGRDVIVNNIINIKSTATSTSTATGALIVAGGVAIGGDVWIQGRLNAESLKIIDSVFDSTAIVVNTLMKTEIDTYSIQDFRSAKYLVQIDDGLGINAKFEVIEILLLINNDGTVYATEYGLVTSDGELGEFTADVQSDNMLRLYFTAFEATNKLVRVLRTAMSV